jgi:hypothetical protein
VSDFEESMRKVVETMSASNDRIKRWADDARAGWPEMAQLAAGRRVRVVADCLHQGRIGTIADADLTTGVGGALWSDGTVVDPDNTVSVKLDGLEGVRTFELHELEAIS